MSGFALASAFAAVVWWFTTGVILYLDGLPVATFRWSLAAASVVAACAIYALHVSSSDPSVGGVYCAFSCAILVWGWLEMSFLMGFVTGPRKTGCNECCSGWRHFVHATQAIIYNELATLGAAIGIAALTWNAANRVALWTFLVLWSMRLSAKLNLFFGVPNVGEKLLPAHLHYLKSFFRTRAMNFLFPLSVTGSTVVLVLLIRKYMGAQGASESVSCALLGTLLALAIVEHWFMVLPLPSERLWAWALRGHPKQERRENAGCVEPTLNASV